MPWLAASEQLATVNATPRVTAATAMPPRYAHWVTRSAAVAAESRRRWREAVAAEPERVRDDADRAHRHRGRREDRVEQDAVPPVQGAGGDRDERQVVDERPAEALLDGGDGAPGQGDGGHDAAQVTADQGDVEAATATSAPVPSAMPRSAAASATESLMPSPAIATTWPCCCSATTWSAFSDGSTSASTCSMPTWRATAAAVAALSPSASTPPARAPSAGRPPRRTPASAGRRPGTEVAAAPSTATNSGVPPSWAAAAAAASRAVVSMPCVVIRRALASSRRPSTVASMPCPGWPRTRSRAASAGRGRGRRPTASPSGARCRARRRRRRLSSPSSVQSPSTVVPVSVGLPRVRVPVLSSTTAVVGAPAPGPRLSR